MLLILVPSGLWMARYAATGPLAGWGLALLALLTSVCLSCGWRAAVQGRFDRHRTWMWRTYLLLCSAVVLRLLTGLAMVAGFDAAWLYPATVWASWTLPLAAFETARWWTGAPPVMQ